MKICFGMSMENSNKSGKKLNPEGKYYSERSIKVKYRKIDKYKYQLMESVIRQTSIGGQRILTPYIELWYNGEMKIMKSYAWNGSNWSLDWKSIEASMFHDAGYSLMQMGLLGQEHRKYFDKLYRDILIEKGLWKWHADFRYNILRKFGGTSAKLTDKPQNPIFKE